MAEWLRRLTSSGSAGSSPADCVGFFFCYETFFSFSIFHTQLQKIQSAQIMYYIEKEKLCHFQDRGQKSIPLNSCLTALLQQRSFFSHLSSIHL